MDSVSAPSPSAAPASTPSPSPTAGSGNSTPAPVSSRPNSTPPPADYQDKSATPAPDAAAKPTETPAEKKARILKAKINGQEREYNLDEMNDEELTYRLQMSEAARQKMSEAAAIKKQFADFMEGVRKDPFEILKDPAFGGIDLEAISEQRLAEKYRESTLPEHERKVLEAERKAQQYEQRIKQFEQQEQMRRQQAEDAKVEAQLKAQFKQALDVSGLPANDTTMYMLAEEASIADEDGLELSPKQLAARVKEKLSGLTKQAMSGLKGEALAKHLGDDVVKEIIKYSLERVKAKAAMSPAQIAPIKARDLDDEPVRKPKDYDKIREGWMWY